jgi:hypothetical protein
MDNDSPEKFNLLRVLPPDEYLNFANLQNKPSYINETIQTSSEKTQVMGMVRLFESWTDFPLDEF